MTTLIWKLMEPSRSMVKEGGKKTTRRMRASCDRCHHAKTKCIYDEDNHQDCVRCRVRSYTCQRSLSMPRKRTPRPPPREPYPTPPEQFQTPRSSTSSALDARTPSTDASSSSALAGSSPDHQRMPPSELPLFDFAQFADFDASFSPAFFGPLHPDTPTQEPPTSLLASPAAFDTTPRARGSSIVSTTTNSDATAAANHSKHACTSSQTSSTCLELLNRTLRDLQQSPVEGKTLDHVLRLNRALLNVLRSVVDCEAAPRHHPAADFTVYFCVTKLVATYHEALYTPCCAASVQFGSYVVDGEDQVALKCQMILIDVRKIAGLLERMQARARQREEEEERERRMGVTGGGRGPAAGRCRRQCAFLHRFARNEVERVTRHIRLLGG